MRRSEINRIIREAKEFLASHQFRLPPWAFWRPADWKGKGDACREITERMLGWDITDFGSGRFEDFGLFLFTLRNGDPGASDGKNYAEKIMIVGENQETPYHFHWFKVEDIINRGGGNLVLQIHGSTEDEGLSRDPATVSIDGIRRVLDPCEQVILKPGESICLETGVYHRFHGEPGGGRVLVGEVSKSNDDRTDNRFLEPTGRFPDIEEDEEPLHLLVNDYPKYL